MSGDQLPAPAEGVGPPPVTPAANEPSVNAGAAAVAIQPGGVTPTAETAATPTESVADQAKATAAPIASADTDTVVTPATPALATAATAAAAPVVSPFRRRGLAVVAGLTRLLRFAFMLALFGVGVAFGYQSYLSSQPLPSGPAADPATAGNQPAPVIRELIAAVGTNDADRIRSAMPSEPYKLFTSEMQRWEFKEVTSVETLATFEDGTRTATSFVMLGRDIAGNPIAMTLVAETQDGNIVGFK
jgi:hypothetical protein